MILDLMQFAQEVLEVKILDGTTIKLKKPTQGMLIKMMGIQKSLSDDEDTQKQLQEVRNFVLLILNNNTEERKFTVKDIADYDIYICKIIMQGYTDFIAEVNGRKN